MSENLPESPVAASVPELTPRTWCYASPPHVYAIGPCACGTETQWSEFERHLWCDFCKLDFLPKDDGIFDGPIPINLAAGMGVRFDRINLKTRKFERFDIDLLAYVDEDGKVVENLSLPMDAPAPVPRPTAY